MSQSQEPTDWEKAVGKRSKLRGLCACPEATDMSRNTITAELRCIAIDHPGSRIIEKVHLLDKSSCTHACFVDRRERNVIGTAATTTSTFDDCQLRFESGAETPCARMAKCVPRWVFSAPSPGCATQTAGDAAYSANETAGEASPTATQAAGDDALSATPTTGDEAPSSHTEHRHCIDCLNHSALWVRRDGKCACDKQLPFY